MPYLTDSVRIDCPFLDRRTKLLPCQREMILFHRERGLSQRQLAELFHVSRRLITFILDPEKAARSYEVRVENGGSKAYYNREKHTAYQRKHRQIKHKLLAPTL